MSHASFMNHSLSDSFALAAVVVGRVLKGDSLSRAMAEMQAAGPLRAAAQSLAYATLRDYGRADALLRALVARPPTASLQGLLLAAILELEADPRGVHQRAAHTVVHQAVEAAGRVAPRMPDKARGLVNGVLRNLQRQDAAWRERLLDNDLARYQHPQWWIDLLRADWPQHWEAMLAAGNGQAPMLLRVNRRRISGEAYLQQCQAAGIAAELLGPQALRLAEPCVVERLPGFSQGLVSVQDWAAQQAAPLLDVQPGMRVLDACAAPGDKTAHIAELAPCNLAEFELTAVDVDAQRLARVGDNLRRLGLSARLVCADAGEGAGNAGADIGSGYHRILLDAPCSASGVVRRHPDIKWLRRAADIPRFAVAQARLLAALCPRLAPGGRLLYATCSVFAGENQRVIAAFLAAEPGARALPMSGIADNIAVVSGGPAAVPRGTAAAPPGLQVLPGGNTDGFYYALLEKA